MKKPIKIDNPSQIFKSPSMFLAFGFGSGLSPITPGTVGTLASIPVYLMMVQFDWLVYGLITFAAAVIGVFICGAVAKKLGVPDHSGIVWDEFVGFWITMMFVPFSWTWILVGFLLFRFFDMAKPWPISLADKHIHGGFGIMFDDVLAGFAALGALQLIIWWFV